MQSKFWENVETSVKEAEGETPEKEKCLMEYEDKERHFRENFKYGATIVLRHEGQFFFWGDMRHSGRENIFFNARKIKSMMESNGHTMGHMNYNDPPTFSSKWDWDRQEKERNWVYKNELFRFVGDEIREAEPMGGNPVDQRTLSSNSMAGNGRDSSGRGQQGTEAPSAHCGDPGRDNLGGRLKQENMASSW